MVKTIKKEVVKKPKKTKVIIHDLDAFVEAVNEPVEGIKPHRGLVSVETDSPYVKGDGTTFTKTFKVGSQIIADGELRNVKDVTSDTELTTDPWLHTAVEVPYGWLY